MDLEVRPVFSIFRSNNAVFYVPRHHRLFLKQHVKGGGETVRNPKMDFDQSLEITVAICEEENKIPALCERRLEGGRSVTLRRKNEREKERERQRSFKVQRPALTSTETTSCS